MAGILLLLLLIILYNSFRYYKEHLLFNQLASINKDDYFSTSLFDKFLNQIQGIDIQYKIRVDEKSYILEILHCFQKYMNTCYFKNKLQTSLNLVSLNDLDYFFYHLYLYLNEHDDEAVLDYNFSYQMFISKPNLEYTPFGISYKKMKLIVTHYCSKSKAITKIDPTFTYRYHQEKEFLDNYVINK